MCLRRQTIRLLSLETNLRTQVCIFKIDHQELCSVARSLACCETIRTEASGTDSWQLRTQGTRLLSHFLETDLFGLLFTALCGIGLYFEALSSEGSTYEGPSIKEVTPRGSAHRDGERSFSHVLPLQMHLIFSKRSDG